MVNKYPDKSKKPKCEPQKKECIEQRNFEDKTFELKVFNFLRENLSIELLPLKEGKYVISLNLKNPITGEIKELDKDYT